MYGWYGDYSLRDNNGELSSHLPPPPVEYITYSEYLEQHPKIIQTPEISNLTFNVSLMALSPPTVVTAPPAPEPVYCINDGILYGIAAAAAFFLFTTLVLIIVLVCCYRRLKHPK